MTAIPKSKNEGRNWTRVLFSSLEKKAPKNVRVLDVETHSVSLKESVGSCQNIKKLIFVCTENSSDSLEKQVNFITLPYPLGPENTPELRSHIEYCNQEINGLEQTHPSLKETEKILIQVKINEETFTEKSTDDLMDAIREMATSILKILKSVK